MGDDSLKVFSLMAEITEDQEIIVKQTYAALLKIWGYDIPLSVQELDNKKSFVTSTRSLLKPVATQPAITVNVSSTTQTQFSKASLSVAHLNVDVAAKKDEKHDKHHHNSHPKLELDKELAHYKILHFNSDDTHASFFSALTLDSPDILMLRFIAARKFELHPAIHMLVKCLDWRINSHPVNDWVLGGDAEVYWGKKHPEMVDAFKMNQVYLRGRDKEDRPIVVIEVEKHLRKNCPDHDFERLICLVIEWVRLELKPYQRGVTKASILFDMTGFGMKNADLAAVHFLAVMFEANYPESLGMIWIHNAPWIFNAVWKIIKGWLDPVVASKIRFTKGSKDLLKFIDPQFIPAKLGGKDTYKPEYIVPTPENCGKTPKDEKFRELITERNQLVMTFIEATIKWVLSKDSKESAEYERVRSQLQIDISRNYLKIDPYIRTKSCYERAGQIKVNGI